MHLSQHRSCTRKMELALEGKLYLDFHWVTRWPVEVTSNKYFRVVYIMSHKANFESRPYACWLAHEEPKERGYCWSVFVCRARPLTKEDKLQTEIRDLKEKNATLSRLNSSLQQELKEVWTPWHFNHHALRAPVVIIREFQTVVTKPDTPKSGIRGETETEFPSR